MKTFLNLLARVTLAAFTFVVTLLFTVTTGVVFFWAVDTLWTLLYVLGVPLLMTLVVDRRWFP